MKIAVAYENGEICPHFGHAPMFAIYESDENMTQLSTKRCVEPQSSGHNEMAALMDSLDIDVVICGNIGEGGRHALEGLGIAVFAGFAGNADTAADMLLRGELPYIPEGGACAHHHDGGCCCHGAEEEGCDCGHDHEHEHGEGCGCGCGH